MCNYGMFVRVNCLVGDSYTFIFTCNVYYLIWKNFDEMGLMADMTKTRNRPESRLANGLSQFLWNASFITVLLF